MNGNDLLQEFSQTRSESAFSEVVRRYTNLVYSVAQRRLGNQSLAQEVAQTVFIRLAKSVPKLRSDTELIAWLHGTTVHVSIDLWRSEFRRRTREEHAAAMQPNPDDAHAWKEIAPALDEALHELNDPDQQTILLRFFQDKSMRELGGALGITEDAAKMRVSRALERLRDRLGARGVTCTAIALGALLMEHSVEAAPGEVSTAIAEYGYVIGEGIALTATGAAPVAFGIAKLAVGMAALTIVGVSTWLVVGHQHAAQSDFPMSVRSETWPASKSPPTNSQDTKLAAGTNEPSPMKLLQAVVRARQRIVSGSINFKIETFHPAERQTNHWLVSAVFDGTRRRFEQTGREYSYTYDSDPAKAAEIQAKADAYGRDKEGAVQAGLLKGFESHYLTTYDGAALLRYCEIDDKPNSATVEDASKGCSQFVFDPRCLGLSPSLSSSSLEQWNAWVLSKSVELAGKELVDGVATLHLRVPSEQPSDLWLDAGHPTRVLKVQEGVAMATSRYDPADRGSPIPVEMINTYFRSGAPDFGTRVVQTASQFNTSVDPVTFTLAGLGMKIGTDVIDSRIMRRIGYWTGTGLSESLPRNKTKVPADEPTLEEMLAILDNNDPASDAAFEAAEWILLNTPDGAAVERAAAVIRKEHVQSPDLTSLCQRMERLRHRCTAELLGTILKENPHPEVRAAACFTLATLRKDECKYGEDKKVAAEAGKLFERVINEFSQAGPAGADLASKAKAELSELRRLTIGKTAPDFEGIDLNGQRVRLSEQRGKVVVVLFWGNSTAVDLEEQQRLLSAFAGRFVWISIYCGDPLGKVADAIEKNLIPGPVILDGRPGPISDDWNVHRWPTVFVLDQNGVIRSRDARGQDLAEAVKALLPK